MPAESDRPTRAAQRSAARFDATLGALRTASKHPSARSALVDIQAQFEVLLPDDLMGWVPLARLEQFPRYLRAAQTRLARAVTDPRKDADKLAPLSPLWSRFLAHRGRRFQCRRTLA